LLPRPAGDRLGPGRGGRVTAVAARVGSSRLSTTEISMADLTLTWLGHGSFRFDTPGGKRIYLDPFLNGNPKCPEGEVEPERVDLIAITHGHMDHVGDAPAL